MKIKKVLISIVFIFIFKHAHSQQWLDVGGGIDQWVNSMEVDTVNNLLYVGGSFHTAGGMPANNIAIWNGTSWQTVGNDDLLGSINAIAFYNGDIIVGGQINSAGNTHVNNIARFDGVQWHALDSGFNDQVNALCVYNGELYAGGAFIFSDTTFTPHIAKWNGNNWENVPGSGGASNVEAMRAFENKLCIAQSPSVHTWDGTMWGHLGNPFNDDVLDLKIFQNELYAVGRFASTAQNPSNYIGRWDGTTWQFVQHPVMSGSFPAVYALQEFQNQMYISGKFIDPPKIAKLNGSDYDSLCNSMTGSVTLFAVYNNQLYVGGIFTEINQVTLNNIARFQDNTGMLQYEQTSDDVEIFPNPTITEEDVFVRLNTKNFNRTKIVVYNSATSILFSSENYTTNLMKVKLENFKPGIYFISISIDNHPNIFKKLIVIK
jgi:hypothetical protein